MSIKPILRGILITGLSLLLLSFLGGLIFTLGPFSGQGLPRFSQWLVFVALLLGSVVSSKNASVKGLFHGLGSALSAALIISFFGLLLGPGGGLLALILPKFLLALAAGTLGSVLGTLLNQASV
ncbi:MAG: TIGR04086 family membrane protein [Peptococcaceae bacterium]|nr:TIGR04086 family membrane protein [Peptococcaceae bacterium]